MIEFPIQDLMDEDACRQKLLQILHPDGLACPHCGSNSYRLARRNRYYESYRCKDCQGYFSAYSQTVFAHTRQSASTLLLLLRGVAKGETSSKLSAELQLNYGWLLSLRRRIQERILAQLPDKPMEGNNFEMDELFQNAGEKRGQAS